MKESTTPKAVTVQKEEIGNFKFPVHEVLKNNEEIKLRQRELERATTLGNIEHSKIKITFEDDGGLKRVETTIWATTERNIVLKQGVVLPIHRIHKVDIY